MAKRFAQKFYKSKQWHDLRIYYISKCHGLCETCLENSIITPGKILHHVIHLTPENINDPNITLNENNLKFECQKCHDKHEGHGLNKGSNVTMNGLKFDGNGQLIKESE